MTHQVNSADGAQADVSLYGETLLDFMEDFDRHRGSAIDAAVHVITNGGRQPREMAEQGLALTDRAAFDLLAAHPELAFTPITPLAPENAASLASGHPEHLQMAVNTMGRFYLRPLPQQPANCHEADTWRPLGTIALTPPLVRQLEEREDHYRQLEDAAMLRLRDALQRRAEAGELASVLDQVIDDVEHVESVCFYSGDTFFALIDRFNNLVDSKAGNGFLPRLRGVPFEQWTAQHVLIVGALHALFVSGSSVRFEEFNGAELTAQGVVSRLMELNTSYSNAGCPATVAQTGDLFDLAVDIRRQTRSFVGRPQLRYRWIYALTFRKTERLLDDTRSDEDPMAHVAEFDALSREVMGCPIDPGLPQSLVFTQIASACMARDLRGVPLVQPGSAASGWVEFLMERVVASAVHATGSDYGMSSSLRDIARLVVYDDAQLSDVIHALTPADFYTCFVSSGFSARLDPATANLIASSVQKRMMFNRWHFIPGNLERGIISTSRHWYYPPLIPDIAVHSHVHRAAHARAQVKFSIRSPGPDMSRPPLHMGGHNYRGFYDIRVVRMSGTPYTTEELLRTRRRTLWLEAVFSVIANHLEDEQATRYCIRGFNAGQYLDLPATQARDVTQAEPVQSIPA